MDKPLSISEALLRAFENEDLAEFEAILKKIQGTFPKFLVVPDNWIIHTGELDSDGFPIGIDRELVVRVLTRGMETIYDSVKYFRWHINANGDDIIAYKFAS